MVKREKIQYLNKLIRREETLQISLPFSVQNELNKAIDDWRYKFDGHVEQTIKVFESSYSKIHWYMIKPTNEFEDFSITRESTIKINHLKESYRLRIPHHFIELDLEFEENNTNHIRWIDTIKDEETLNIPRNEFHKIENPSILIKQLIVREQMIQLLKEIWDVYKLPATTIKIQHKRVHFVDSSPGLCGNIPSDRIRDGYAPWSIEKAVFENKNLWGIGVDLISTYPANRFNGILQE